MSLRKKEKKLLRWRRWEDKVMKSAGPDMLALPGALRAHNAYVRQWNGKQNRELAKEASTRD